MRRNFAQVLREGKIDLKNEYTKLYDLFYGKDSRDGKSVADFVSANIQSIYFCRTCLSLEEFDSLHDIHFEKQPQDFNIDYLINFCEYVFNFIAQLGDGFFFSGFNRIAFIDYIYRVTTLIGYQSASEDGITIFVPKDNIAIAVSQSKLIPDGMSYKVISYSHHSKKCDLEEKRVILQALANALEPYEKKLVELDKSFKSDLFYALNSFNIRHNNVTSTDKKNYKKVVAEMSNGELEHWYDETFQMCLLAFMRLEQADRKANFDALQSRIETET